MLGSGVRLLDALKVAQKQQTGVTKAALAQIAVDIRKGSDLTTALSEHGSYFPELVIDMVSVAEQTGALPEVLRSLAEHYENLQRLRRTFLGAIAWPLFQLLAAVFVIAGLLLVIGWIAQANPNAEAFDPLGFGLRGGSGALIWLGGCFGSFAAVFFGYQLAVKGFRQAKVIHGLLLTIPVVGHCLRSFAIARFSWAFALTQQAGMPIGPSLEASLKATANGAFMAASPQVVAMVMAGEDLTDALAATDMFPLQYIELIRVGETSGTVPETLERLSPQFEDDARRSLYGLTITLGWVIWAIVAMLIIFLIFRVMSFYLQQIYSLM